MAETWQRLSAVGGRAVPEEYHGRLGTGLVVGIGLALLAISANGLLDPADDPVALAFGTVIPVALSALLLLGGLALPRTDYGSLTLRIGLWCLIGVGLLVGMSLITIQYQRTQGVNLQDVPLVLTSTATGGGVIGFLIGVYDADRLETERRMAAEHRRAEELGRRLSVLNRVLRHDIRNDVNVIHGNAERIIHGIDAEDAAQTIKAKASKLHRMSENAREIESLMERGEFPTESIDVAALAESKRRDVERDYPGVEIEASIPASAWASANPMIESAAENVIENAVKHNDSDHPVLGLAVDVTDRHVTLRVADNGPGLPEEEVSVLRRGRETDLEHASGLGLWLVNWIVTESGGEVDFERNDPRGSVVSIRLSRTDPPS
jgi:signal transduction histidine kinase